MEAVWATDKSTVSDTEVEDWIGGVERGGGEDDSTAETIVDVSVISVEKTSLDVCKTLDVRRRDEDTVLSDETKEVELGGCSNELESELGSKETVGSDKVALGDGRIEKKGESCVATSDSVGVDVTIAISGVGLISTTDIVSRTSKMSDSIDAVD